MPFKITMFSDDEDNQMGCFINDENKLMIIISESNDKTQNYIKLDKNDLCEVITTLKEMYEQV